MNAIRSFDPGIFRDLPGYAGCRLSGAYGPLDKTTAPHGAAHTRTTETGSRASRASVRRSRWRRSGTYRRARRQACGVASGTWRCAAAAGGHAAVPRKNHSNHKGLSRIRPALSHLVPHPKTFGRAHRACGGVRFRPTRFLSTVAAAISGPHPGAVAPRRHTKNALRFRHFRAASRSSALRFKGRGSSRLARILSSQQGDPLRRALGQANRFAAPGCGRASGGEIRAHIAETGATRGSATGPVSAPDRAPPGHGCRRAIRLGQIRRRSR